jgi:uncharacterized protein YmfQ (DUF2313 family)
LSVVFTGLRYAGTPEGDYLTDTDGALLLFPGFGDQPTPEVPPVPSPWVPAERPAAYAGALQALLPLGAAWTRAPGAVLTQLLAAIGDGLADQHGFIDRLFGEAYPQAARDLLPEYEATLGLPTPCLPELAPTEAQRAAEVRTRWTASGGATPAYFEALAAAAGYSARVFEYRASRCGVTRCGDPLIGLAATHTWRLDVETGGGGGQARCGDARCGDPFAWPGRHQALECLIKQQRPAHTTVLFRYVEPPADTVALPPGNYLAFGDAYLTAGENGFLALG